MGPEYDGMRPFLLAGVSGGSDRQQDLGQSLTFHQPIKDQQDQALAWWPQATTGLSAMAAPRQKVSRRLVPGS